MGGVHKPRKDVLARKKKKKRQIDSNVGDEKIIRLQIKKFNLLQGVTQNTLFLFKQHMHTHKGYNNESVCVLSKKTRKGPLQQESMTVHPADYLDTVALEAVLASGIYSCATWDYIQSDLLDYLVI